jgi:DnaJ-domain-containing protein 1
MVNTLLNALANRFLQNTVINAQQYFLSNISLNEQDNNLHAFFFDLVRYLIWQAKLEKKISTISRMLTELEYHLSIILGTNKKLLEQINNCVLFQNGGHGAADGHHEGP